MTEQDLDAVADEAFKGLCSIAHQLEQAVGGQRALSVVAKLAAMSAQAEFGSSVAAAKYLRLVADRVEAMRPLEGPIH